MRSTNSRQWAALLLRDLISETGSHQVLDVGSGDGQLAIALSEAATYVAAVEPDLRMQHALEEASSRHRGVEYVPGRIQEADLPRAGFDIALLSYVLETLSADEQDAVLNSALQSLRPGGLLIGVSYLEGSYWDQYLELCKNLCGGTRYVGFGELAKSLRTRGWIVARRTNFNTRIVAADLDELFTICSHFMGRRSSSYMDSRPILLPLLEKFSRPAGTRTVALDVSECLYMVDNRWLPPRE